MAYGEDVDDFADDTRASPAAAGTSNNAAADHRPLKWFNKPEGPSRYAESE